MTLPLDPVMAAPGLMAAMGRLGGRPLASLTVDQLEWLKNAGFDLSAAAFAERKRRETVRCEPRGCAGLRLVADGGELTEAGQRIVRARNASRARWARRSA